MTNYACFLSCVDPRFCIDTCNLYAHTRTCIHDVRVEKLFVGKKESWKEVGRGRKGLNMVKGHNIIE